VRNYIMKKYLRLKLIAVSSVLTLSACGGGSSSGGSNTASPAQSAGGIWTGMVTNVDGTSYDAAGFITESGELRFITDDGEQTTGTITVTGGQHTASLTSYAPFGTVFTQNGVSVISGTASGALQERSTFSGTTTFAGVETSSFSFTYDDIYERDSTLAVISGIYSDSDGLGYTETYTIDSAGTITGSDTDGCIFNGSVSILNSNYNMYRINLSVDNCGNLNGAYIGLGALGDEGGSLNDTLVISITGSEFVITGTLPRT
jgi:hypothetical protein